mgnify:CR=1 FL=1
MRIAALVLALVVGCPPSGDDSGGPPTYEYECTLISTCDEVSHSTSHVRIDGTVAEVDQALHEWIDACIAIGALEIQAGLCTTVLCAGVCGPIP